MASPYEKLREKEKKKVKDLHSKWNPENMTFIEVGNLYYNFLQLCKKNEIDPQKFDFEQELVDWTLSYSENMRRLEEKFHLNAPVGEELPEELQELEKLREENNKLQKRLKELKREEKKIPPDLEDLSEKIEKLVERGKDIRIRYEDMMEKVVTKEDLDKLVDRLNKDVSKFRSGVEKVSKRRPREQEEVEYHFEKGTRFIYLLRDSTQVARCSYSTKELRDTEYMGVNLYEINNMELREKLEHALKEWAEKHDRTAKRFSWILRYYEYPDEWEKLGEGFLILQYYKEPR